jgi:hypothetical protein
MGALNFDPEAALASIRETRSTAAKAANPAKVGSEFSNFSNFSRVPPSEIAVEPPRAGASPSRNEIEKGAQGAELDHGVPSAWIEGLARLDPARRLAGFSADGWRQLIHDGRRFLGLRGSEAASCGWTAADVFGLHPLAPGERHDGMGLVPLIRGGDVIAISAEHATIRMLSGTCLTYYLRLPRPEAVPAWELQEMLR